MNDEEFEEVSPMLEMIRTIQTISSPFLDSVFILITMLGEEMFYLLVLTWIYWCGNKEFGYRLSFAYISSTLVSTGLKDIFMVPRPIGEEGIRSLRIETADGYSFPSGHTQGTASFWTAIALHLKRPAVTVLAAVVTALVGFSRMYLGVHTILDVAGGLVIGILVVYLSNAVFDLVRRTRSMLPVLLIAVPMTSGLFVFTDPNYFKSSGLVFSFMIGYYLDRDHLKYVPPESWKRKIFVFLPAVAVLMGIRLGLKAVLPVNAWSDLFRYLFMGLWVTVGTPLMATPLLKKRRREKVR